MDWPSWRKRDTEHLGIVEVQKFAGKYQHDRLTNVFVSTFVLPLTSRARGERLVPSLY